MKTKILDTVLLFALPASGKSEVRTYMDSKTFLSRLGGRSPVGPTLQLDDYPYVHFMHRIDDELKKHGMAYVFYKGPDRPFANPFEWGTLIELLNEDYDDLLNNRVFTPGSASQLMFDRLDRARAKVGLPEALAMLPWKVRLAVGAALEEETAAELARKNATCAQDRKGRTIFIEAARGGANGAAFPLTPPFGYGYAFERLSDAILDRAGVLYIWVTPEESRRKNRERGRPDGQGSILHHMVPMEVMLGDYGCDDMEYLISTSGRKDSVKVERIVVVKDRKGQPRYAEKTWHLPVARFDNRKDLTTFVRKPEREWKPAEAARIHDELVRSLTILARA